jgi:hypothetical protein
MNLQNGFHTSYLCGRIMSACEHVECHTVPHSVCCRTLSIPHLVDMRTTCTNTTVQLITVHLICYCRILSLS